MDNPQKPKKQLSEKQINNALSIRKPMFLESARELVKYLESINDPLWWHNRPKFHYCVASFSSAKAEEWYQQHPDKRPQIDIGAEQEQQISQPVNQQPVNHPVVNQVQVSQQQPQNNGIPDVITVYGHNVAPQTVQPASQQPVSQPQQPVNTVQETAQNVVPPPANPVPVNNAVQPVNLPPQNAQPAQHENNAANNQKSSGGIKV